MVFTDCLCEINCKLSLEIDDKSYPIFISEKIQNYAFRSGEKAENPSSWPPSPGSPSPIHANSNHEKSERLAGNDVINFDLGNDVDKPNEYTPLHQSSDIPKNDGA